MSENPRLGCGLIVRSPKALHPEVVALGRYSKHLEGRGRRIRKFRVTLGYVIGLRPAWAK